MDHYDGDSAIVAVNKLRRSSRLTLLPHTARPSLQHESSGVGLPVRDKAILSALFMRGQIVES